MGVLAACATDEVPTPDVEATSFVEVYALPEGHRAQLDLLFVIDATTAMASYQDRVAALPAAFERAFPSIGFGLIDVHIGVTTTGGALRGSSAVGGPFMTMYTEFDLTRVANFGGTLVEALSPLVNVGAASAAPNQPLAAALKVLEENPGGFHRAGTPLGIVIVSASDDASPLAASEYARLIKAIEEPTNVGIAAITDGPTPRLDELLTGFVNRAVRGALIDDAQPALEFFGQFIKSTLAGACWHPSDVDPITPGNQFDCTFTVMIRDQERVLPPCRLPGDQFCWSFEAANYCEVGRLEPQFPPYGINFFRPALRAECVVLR
jgi:hypothetical protein